MATPRVPITEARNNTLVAESDFQTALTTLQSYTEKENVLQDDDNDDDDGTIQAKLYQDCVASLTSKLRRVVQVVDDTAYHVYIQNSTSSTTTPTQQQQQQQPHFSFTDNELVDQIAVTKVRQLRQSVREASSRIVQLRQTTLETALQGMSLEWKLPKRMVVVANHNTSGGGGESQATATANSSIDAMKAALQILQENLEATSHTVPQSLQTLTETVSQIEASLQLPLTRHERALQSLATTTSGENVPPPQQQLTHLLCKDV